MTEFDAEGERSATPVEPEPEPDYINIDDVEPEPEPELIGIKEGTNEWNLFQLRNIRNSYLHLTDRYLISDYPITPEKLEIIKNYRQMLREFININTDLILSGGNIEIPPIPI